jgi:hypothetical protein
MIRDRILSKLSESGGATIGALLQSAALPLNAETSAAVEVLLHYSRDVVTGDGKWKLADEGKSATLLAQIKNYSVATGRSIFRLSSALAQLPPHEHPNEDELRQALDLSHGEYELLPNAMIKRNHQ